MRKGVITGKEVIIAKQEIIFPDYCFLTLIGH